MRKILIVEDDPAMQKGLTEYFKSENYEVIATKSGEKGLMLAKKETPDIILLDLILPDKDGIEVCKELRSTGYSTPVIMLTSKKEETDKIIGLEIGADDYVTKPFSIRELHARIKAILRRKNEITTDIEEYRFGNIKLDFKKMEAVKNSEPIKLSALEFKILKYLIERKGEVISRDKLLDDVWNYESFPTTRTVDNYILSLRKKIEDNPAEPVYILTMHKSGYKFTG